MIIQKTKKSIVVKINCNKVYKLFFYLQNLKNSLYFIYSRGVIMNKKGFAVSGMIYAILVLFLILVFSILSILGSRKLTFDKLKKDVLTSLNNDYISYNPNAPELYDNMIPMRNLQFGGKQIVQT